MQVQAQADQLNEALARSGQQDTGTAPGQDVIWLTGQSQASANSAPNLTAADATPAVQNAQPAGAQQASLTTPTVAEVPSQKIVDTTPLNPSLQAPDRSDAMAGLRDAVIRDDPSAMHRAIAAVGLSLVDRQKRLDPSLTADLSMLQRRAVDRYMELTHELARLVELDQTLDRDTAEQALRQAYGDEPIDIARVELCRSVRGYGVYEPFESTSYIAGRENAMIVYVEVERFTTLSSADAPLTAGVTSGGSGGGASGGFRVELEQEVVLYNQSDGLAIWREKPVKIEDVSRNRRRDFFVVQLIKLPANLPTGKYVLKVTVKDELAPNKGAFAESAKSIQIVADQSVVSGR